MILWLISSVILKTQKFKYIILIIRIETNTKVDIKRQHLMNRTCYTHDHKCAQTAKLH